MAELTNGLWSEGVPASLLLDDPVLESGNFWPVQHQGLLQRSPERYCEMVQSITAFGVHLVDRGGIIRSWNQGAENITGFSRAQVIGKNYSALFPPDSIRDGVPQRTLEFVRAHRHSTDDQARLRSGGQHFLAQTSLDVVRSDDTGEVFGFVEVFQDVTETREREAQLYQRATRDPMTGLFNRGHFLESATLEFERARRFNDPLSILVIDIDHFKRVNDHYGHAAGDHAIQALANVCRAWSRKIDTIGRLGGEEFCVVLPRANKEPATEMAQRLRRAISEIRIPIGGGREIGIAASIGVAAMRPTSRDIQELIRQADAALYQAKREGRNRVKAWFE